MFHVFTGAGEPMLAFVHGLTCDHSDWDGQVAHFERQHRCLTLDLPGHGRSPVPGALTIERLAAEVVALLSGGAAPVVLIGHSMGCRVCLEAAHHLRDQVEGLVFVDGSCFAEGDPEAARAATLRRVAELGFEAVIDGLFEPMFTPDSPAAFKQRAIARAHAMSLQQGPGLVADMHAWDAGPGASRLASVRAPVLAIQSTCVDASRLRTILEPGQTTPWTDALTATLPHARVEYLPGIGHFTMNEAPAEVNRLMEEFLASL